MTDRFAYDEVPYDTEANPEAHPRSMGTLARLFGLHAAPAASARVLEIGCGDGEHMIAAASYLPQARFVGFDLAAEAIARGVESARAIGVGVELLHRDVCDVRARGLEVAPSGTSGASFDYVVAHGVYSWVPETIRHDVLAVMRSALAPSGIGFLSVNASPGWELRRALRILMREATAEIVDPADKVRAALALVDDLAAATAPARGEFASVLAKAAGEYRAHVVSATPPDAPFSRYVFHDLLAECNDPFSVEELDERLRAAGLRMVCETPMLHADRGFAVADLAAVMAATGKPFLQVLVCRDDAPGAPPRGTSSSPALDAIRGMYLWADLAPAREAAGTYRTTTGVHVGAGASGTSWLARAARFAPGFVAVKELADDEESLATLEHDLFESARGLFTIAIDAPPIGGIGEHPRVAAHVRLRARGAVERGARSAVLTSALHRSYRVPWTELVVVRELDGKTDRSTISERVARAVASAPSADLVPGAISRGFDSAIAAHVDTVLDRFARYGFLLLPASGSREDGASAREVER